VKPYPCDHDFPYHIAGWVRCRKCGFRRGALERGECDHAMGWCAIKKPIT
jgi:hypothetical protein